MKEMRNMLDFHAVEVMSETDKQIYKYVVKNVEKVKTMGVRELADETHTSTATIVRFYKGIGAQSFENFKREISILYRGPYLMNKDREIKDIETNIRRFQMAKFDQLIDAFRRLIQSHEYIVFLGVGNSGEIAKYGARFFSNVGYYATAITDPDYPPILRGLSKHLIIVISESGETFSVIKKVKTLKEHNSKIVLLTNFSSSTLTSLADLTINYHCTHVAVPHSFNLTSAIPVIYIIERVGYELYNMDKRILEAI